MEGVGYRCDWQWTSDLHAPKIFTDLGLRLARRAFADHPVCRANSAAGDGQAATVSFIIGHRGLSRLPHLLATIESIAGQRDVAIECVVVEQDVQPQLAGRLPPWVRYIHAPPPSADMPYCRSWAFNIGANMARGELLILHDNDMMVPTGYAAESLKLVRQGYELVNLKRFVFYLSEEHTTNFFAGTESLLQRAPESIMQNAQGGGSIAITREAFDRIGGMDEGFIGWGGEDNEFWERAQTLRVWPYGFLSLIHLWHPAQPGKQRTDSVTLQRHRQLSSVPVEQRIERLRQLSSGNLAGPVLT